MSLEEWKGRAEAAEAKLRIALQDIEDNNKYHPICEHCGRVCWEVSFPSSMIAEYKCHFCLERESAEAQVKTLEAELDKVKHLRGLEFEQLVNANGVIAEKQGCLDAAQKMIEELKITDVSNFKDKIDVRIYCVNWFEYALGGCGAQNTPKENGGGCVSLGHPTRG